MTFGVVSRRPILSRFPTDLALWLIAELRDRGLAGAYFVEQIVKSKMSAHEERRAAFKKCGPSLTWLPGRDSNPRPIGYKCSDISVRLGLSHHPPQADVGRCGGLLDGVLNL